jgi:hypothetical protein
LRFAWEGLEHFFRFGIPRYRGVDGRKIVGFLFDFGFV